MPVRSERLLKLSSGHMTQRITVELLGAKSRANSFCFILSILTYEFTADSSLY